MDCCSYSYAPHMLEEKPFLYHEDQNGYISVDRGSATCFWLYACDYCGRFEIAEKLEGQKEATARFYEIMQNYF